MPEQPLYDVAVVGYGPTGATLANLLAQCGVSVVVIEREAQMYNLPRAVHFDDETMRVFQTIGIADSLEESVHVNPGMRFHDDNDRLLLDWPRDPNITAQGWHASYRLHQPDLESLLRAQLTKHPLVTRVLNCQLEEIMQQQDSVQLNCIDRQSARPLMFHSRYVVGCDGANSTVRKAIGGGMEDLGFHERWLVVDLLLKTPRPDLGDHSIQFCNPQRPMTYCRSPGIRRRWEIKVLEDETDAQASSHERVWELLSRWITASDATIERSVVYTFRSAIAKHWRRERLLIAGDAAHLTPPFMGQGMCTGIRDAANLAWKLVASLQRESSDELLDSYQQERSSHARSYIETAVRLGGLINSLDRQSALNMANDEGDGQATMKSIAPVLGCSSHIQGGRILPAGSLFSQPNLEVNGSRFDDVAGYSHTIVFRGALTELPMAGVVGLSTAEYPLLEAVLDELQSNAVWVRPDRYIGAVADSADELVDIMAGSLMGDARQ